MNTQIISCNSSPVYLITIWETIIPSSDNPANAVTGDRPRHILVLDDELTVCNALKRLLHSLGYECTTAYIGEELLEIVESAGQTGTCYDLAILDIKIVGGMGGIETMQKMKQLGVAMPVISMSGYSTDEIFSDEEDTKGFSGHLQKPFKKVELLNEIERFYPTAPGP